MRGIYSPISKNERGQSQMRRDQLPSSKEIISPITFLKPICTSTFKKRSDLFSLSLEFDLFFLIS